MEDERDFSEILKLFSPGTSLRMALDDLLRARMGALIVFGNENLSKVMDGGFRIETKFSPQKLVELCKMDGAIILSGDGKEILYCNALLIPDSQTQTKETGTRHKAAERTAKQAQTIVIAVSERKNKISIYYKDMSHELERSADILRRCSETLQILEKQRELFNDLIDELNLLELKKIVTTNDVCSVLRRCEIIKRISDEIKKYLIELGKEGRIVSLRLKELMSGLSADEELILKDYFSEDSFKAGETLSKLNFDFLLDDSNISAVLFDETVDKPMYPSGLRLLSKTNLFNKDVTTLVSNFKTLENLLNATDDELLRVLGNEGLVDFFKEEMDSLLEKVTLGKRV